MDVIKQLLVNLFANQQCTDTVLSMLRSVFIGWINPEHLPQVLLPRLNFLEALLDDVDNLKFVSHPTQFTTELLRGLEALHGRIVECQKMDPTKPSRKVEEAVIAVDDFINVINKNHTLKPLLGDYIPSEVGKNINFSICLSMSILSNPSQKPQLRSTPERYLQMIRAIVCQLISEVDRLSRFWIGDEICETSDMRSAKSAKPVDRRSVFYVTNRLLTVDCDYSGHPESSKTLHYGEMIVSIPRNLRRGGKLKEPQIKDAQHLLKPFVHIYEDKRLFADSEAFFTELNVHINEEAGCPDVLLLIHGYNSHLKKSVRRLAKLKKDLDFEGAVILYSNSSGGKKLAYYSDEKTVWATIKPLYKFILNIQHKIRITSRRHTNPSRIHVMAHSMGNQALIGALHHLQDHVDRPLIGREDLPNISQVVFVAADEKVAEFIDLVDRFRRESDDAKIPILTVYCTKEDIALMLSHLHCEIRNQEDYGRIMRGWVTHKVA